MNIADRQREWMNSHILKRNESNIQHNVILSDIPQETRYRVFQLTENKSGIPSLAQQPQFDLSDTFIPSTTKPPFVGFAKNIDIETNLRGQVYALQRGNQAVDIPGSKSDMYGSKQFPLIHKTPPHVKQEVVCKNTISCNQKIPQVFSISSRIQRGAAP